MSRFPERNTPGQRHAQISACDALVDPAKSRRLREMLKGKNADVHASPSRSADGPEIRLDLSADVLRELQRARRIIDDEIVRIMSLLPEGRKNRLFTLRFGALEAIEAMEIQAIFKRLKLDDKRVDLNRLRKINYHGEKTS